MKLPCDSGRVGRIFCCLLVALLPLRAVATAPPTTLVSDVVYRADGSVAGGTLVISWPAFSVAGGQAVAAGTKTVKIGAGGAVSIPLVPNAGAEPAGTYYTVVYKLDDGSTSQEYWSVPSTMATTIAAIRSKLVPASVAMQTVSRQYVDSAIAAALGNGNNDETIGGTKTFLDIHVPQPQGDPDATPKSYVDAAIANVPGGGGGIVPNPTGSQTIAQPAGTKFKVTGGDAQFDSLVTQAPTADVRAFGAVGDCVTNDGPAIQAAIDSGDNVYLPKTRASGQCDYLSNQTLTFASREQRIYGDSGGIGASTIVKFPTNTVGVRCPLNQKGGAALENLNLQGSDEWNASDLSTFVVNGTHTASGTSAPAFAWRTSRSAASTATASSWTALRSPPAPTSLAPTCSPSRTSGHTGTGAGDSISTAATPTPAPAPPAKRPRIKRAVCATARSWAIPGPGCGPTATATTRPRPQAR